ncbi:methyltransferase domain protein [Ceratobasidium sp. AG-Ba]|nr:methyltransferase domain protein [Ceratobasidium sp. AG-Ba]
MDDYFDIVTLPQVASDQASDYDDGIFSESASSYRTMSTLQSREVAEYFRSICGFTYPADENVPLVFPADATADRLDVLLHVMVRLCLGGENVPRAIDVMLREGGVSRDGSGAKVLDVVTNSGTWVNEMAGTYSTAKFVTLDSKPLIPHKPHARIEFQVYDFYAGLMEADNTFDLVHIRQGVLATKDFNFLLRELHRVLKPNGYIMITELPFDTYEGTTHKVPIHSATNIAQGIIFAYEMCAAQGVDTDAWKDMAVRLAPGHPLWGNPGARDPNPGPARRVSAVQNAHGFRDISLNFVPVPIGTWHFDESQQILGGLMRLWGFHQSQSSLPVVLQRGIEESAARAFIENLLQEVMEVDRYRAYMEFQIWLARKI